MSQIEKLEQRLLSKPKDFTFQEAFAKTKESIAICTSLILGMY